MSIFVGLRLHPLSAKALSEWFKECARFDEQSKSGRFDPVAIQNIHIPLVYCNSKNPDNSILNFQPTGEICEVVELKNPEVRYLGERGVIALCFTCPIINQRYEELIDLGFKRRATEFLPHLVISFESHYINEKWLKSLPIKRLTLVEEFSCPFDLDFPKKAHLTE